MARKNPIEARLDALTNQWNAFAQDANGRLLRWLCTAEEVPMVEAFVAKESDADTCDTPDLFVRFTDAFEHENVHGYVLHQSFLKAYEEAKPALLEAGLDASFVPPPVRRDGGDIQAFLDLTRAYHAHQQGKIALLAIYLSPTEVRARDAYQLWLQRLVQRAPRELRFVVADMVASAQLEALANAEEQLVISVACDLDMPAALQETSGEAGLASPGALLRHLLVQLGDAVRTLDVALALRLAQSASALAQRMQSPHLGAVVQSMLAGLHTMTGKPLEALACYAETDRLGQETFTRGEQNLPAPEGAPDLEGESAKTLGLRLRRDARFGQGALLMQQRAYEQAARVFVDSVPLSRALSDARGELDGLRLASQCCEHAGQLDAAWSHGMEGLKVGAAMDEETRRTSSLAYLGQVMLRLTRSSSYRAYAPSIERHMQALLGPDWQNALTQEAS